MAASTGCAKVVWRMRIGSAFRTAIACTIVGCATLYGPPALRTQLAFPAFSYVTAILIVPDATLGDALRGCWHALCATAQVLPLAIVSLWVVGPGRFSAVGAAGAVAATAFLVALPEWTHLTTKRIGFGQIVIVYVGAVVRGESAGAVSHPVHVAVSTLLGAAAALLALVIPYPRLAYWEVRKLCRLYAENARERTNLLLKALSATHISAAQEAISRSNVFAYSGSKLLQIIKLREGSVQWEQPRMKLTRKPDLINPGNRLQEMEIPIRGIETALNSCNSFPVNINDQDLRHVLERAETQICLKLEQAKCFLPLDPTTAPETKPGFLNKALLSIGNVSITHKHLEPFFILFCLQLLHDDSDTLHKPSTKESSGTCSGFQNMKPSHERLVFALKCSVSLGLAVLFGLIFDRENGFWSGLTIAISFVTKRQATFTIANARLQGTAMGSVYGVLGCFAFQRLPKVRFLALLPWIIFTSFLRHSRLYGQAGGISAVIGASLILGRNNYGNPDEFAIARLTEAFIGLSCFVSIELLLQPVRATTLAKTQLSHTLNALQECMDSSKVFTEKKNELENHVHELENFVSEAELEPNFWFVPFRGLCYRELEGSLLRIADLLQFMAYKMDFLQEVSNRNGVAKIDIYHNIELFKKRVGFSLKSLQRDILLKNELQEKKLGHDPEKEREGISILSEEEAEKILNNFLQHSREITDQIRDTAVELKGEMVLCLSMLGFCISGLMRETKEIEKAVKELVLWENPSKNVN